MTTHPSDKSELPPRESEAQRTDAAATAVVCPFCHSTDTERFALFGGRLSTDHYTCRMCHTAFERMRYTAE